MHIQDLLRRPCDTCIYTRGIKDAMVMLVVYVDDLLVVGATSSCVRSIRQQLSSVFSITDQGNILHIIGMNVRYDQEAHTLLINQSGYIKGILEKFGMNDTWTVQSPATEAINTMGPRQGVTANAKEVRHYALLVSSLLWIVQGTQPDIAFAVG
ncbi:uncharacterized protein UBRO_21020 [Ustilago bromivora]|uniref:Reverse transcriptase Ty1/copia-type domain-containing protein n=1 Tax=Ustilago bromivora TaxID=307758 RepID=A0A1K0GDT1_9BASI|nr:uncharacterized protein UBRO_21020 [Ustilago bromivora]